MLSTATANKTTNSRQPEDMHFNGESWRTGHFEAASTLELSPAELSDYLKSKVSSNQYSFLQHDVAVWAVYVAVRLESGISAYDCLRQAQGQFSARIEEANGAMIERVERERPFAIAMKKFPDLFPESVVDIAVNA